MGNVIKIKRGSGVPSSSNDVLEHYELGYRTGTTELYINDGGTYRQIGGSGGLSSVNNSNWSGTDLAVANGGTGASNASDARSNLGLGSLSTLSTINNSNWSGTDLAVANGGTGSSSASGARSNLGLGAGATLNTAAVSNGASTLATGDQIYDHVTTRISGKVDASSLGDLALLDDIAASRVVSGTLGTARIPNLAASKITSGTFDAARIPTIDISSKTNLSAGTNISLSGDTLNVDDAFLKNNADDTTSGTITAGGFTTTGTVTAGASNNNIRLRAVSNASKIGDTFAGNTDQSYIDFIINNSSNDPGYIMHETRSGEANEGVLHLCPSDDNADGDYVSIHGTNDSDQLKLHTSGKIEGVTTLVATTLDISGNVDVDGTLETDALTINGTTSVAFTSSDHSKLDGIESSATADQSASEILTAIKTVDGSGSGLDADTLDGLQLETGSRNDNANKVVRTNSNGYLMTGWINTPSGNTTTASSDYYVNTDDGYIRKKTLANVRTEIMGVSSGSSFLRSDATDTASGAITLSNFVSFTMDGNTITGIDDSGEFTNNDSHIMTSAAVEDKILSYGYTTSGAVSAVANGSNNRIATFSSSTALNGESSLTFDGTTLQIDNRLHLDGSSPFILIEESGVTNTPEFWLGVDGGNFSIRLNNSGTYPFQIFTNSNNNAVDNINIGYSTVVQGNVTLNGIVLDGNTITGIDDSGEFTNNDAHIMTSAAVEDKILGYGYTTAAALSLGDLALLDNIPTSRVNSGTFADARIAASNITQHTDPKYLRSNATDTATGVITFSNTTNSTSKTTGAVKISGGLGVAKTLNAGEDVVAYASSDKKLKDNLKPIENSLDKVSKLSGYEFDWNDKQETYQGHDVGVVAQEVEKVLPEIVTTRDNGYKAVKYEKLVPLLIESIKELKAEIEELKK